MALVVFLRGVNVGGHRTFRPSVLAQELRHFDVVNVGAAGTFVVHKPVSQAKLRAELRRMLPFQTEMVICDGRDLLPLEAKNPFGKMPNRHDTVRFVCVLSKSRHTPVSVPVILPPKGKWLVRIIALNKRFVFGLYRRHMKTIGCLGQIDKLFGVPTTTRNWNTIMAVVQILKKRITAADKPSRSSRNC